jgi:hypothetical protein
MSNVSRLGQKLGQVSDSLTNVRLGCMGDAIIVNKTSLSIFIFSIMTFSITTLSIQHNHTQDYNFQLNDTQCRRVQC